MKKMKLILALTLMLSLCVAPVVPVYGQVRHSIQSTGPIEASANLKLPAGTWVYGIRLFADQANSIVAIYNAADITDASLRIDEIGEATANDTVEVWYPKPIYCATGVSVYIATGVAYVYYGPPPSGR